MSEDFINIPYYQKIAHHVRKDATWTVSYYPDESDRKAKEKILHEPGIFNFHFIKAMSKL